MHYLAFDLETGGTNSRTDGILEGYFAIYDENRVFLDDLYLRIKPDLSKYLVSEEALSVNKINLEELMADPDAVDYDEAKKRLVALLTKHKIKGKRKHFTPMGQNIGFDLDFIWDQLIPKDEWEKLVHHLKMDTLDCTTWMKKAGMLPTEIGNLGSLVEYFNVPAGEAHTAQDDVKMTVEVAWRLMDLLSSFKKDIASNSFNSELLSVVEE